VAKESQPQTINAQSCRNAKKARNPIYSMFLKMSDSIYSKYDRAAGHLCEINGCRQLKKRPKRKKLNACENKDSFHGFSDLSCLARADDV
jgi:hypothetical protein